MRLSQKEFATILGLKTHATISAWESKENKATRMLGTTEVISHHQIAYGRVH